MLLAIVGSIDWEKPDRLAVHKSIEDLQVPQNCIGSTCRAAVATGIYKIIEMDSKA